MKHNNTPTFKRTAISQAVGQTFPYPVPTEAERESWEDLEAIYIKCAEAIVTIGETVNAFLSRPGVIENIQHKTELCVAINGLKTDLSTFTEALLLIHQKHQGRHGVISDENELAACLSISEDYIDYNTHFTSIVGSNLIGITEELANVVRSLSAPAFIEPTNVIEDLNNV